MKLDFLFACIGRNSRFHFLYSTVGFHEPFTAEVELANILLSERFVRIFIPVADQRAFIKRHSRKHAYAMLLTSSKQLAARTLLKQIINNLLGGNPARFRYFNAVLGAIISNRYAEFADFAFLLQLTERFQ